MGELANVVSVETASEEIGSLAIPRASPAWVRRSMLRRRMLAFGDVLAVLGTSALLGVSGTLEVSQALFMAFTAPAWILTAKMFQLYDRDDRAMRHLTVDEAQPLMMWAIVSTSLSSGLILLTQAAPLGLEGAFAFAIVVAVSAFTLRAIARAIWRATTPRDRTVVIGQGEAEQSVLRKLQLFPDIHAEVTSLSGATTAIGICEIAARSDVDRIILAEPPLEEFGMMKIVQICRESEMKLTVIPSLQGMFGTTVRLDHVAELPLLEYSTSSKARSSVLLKRTMDIAVSAAALLICTPFFVFIAILIKLDDGGPVFFSQIRAGLGGRPIRIHKFRTMVVDAEEQLSELVNFKELDEPMFKLAHDPRVTRVGRVLRRWSVDEVPQFFDVFLGRMSLVGPRPEQLDLVATYKPDHLFRLDVKPGLTGPMQVYGRAQLTFGERLAVERDYVGNLSTARDLRIMFLTVAAVFNGRGAS